MTMVVMKIILMVVTTGCVVSQSTIDEPQSDLRIQLEVQIANLAQQHQQTAQLLSRLLDHQQQLLTKLNDIETMLTNRHGKLRYTLEL